MTSSFFKDTAIAEGENVILKDITFQANGAYRIVSAKNTEYCMDVNGGSLMKNSVAIKIYQRHGGSNQQYILNAADFNNSYIYTISTLYSPNYVLDITDGSSANNISLQLYQRNGTAAQNFMLKEVYKRNASGEYEYVGYVFLTGATGYTRALTAKSDNTICQVDFNYSNVDMSQIWYLEKCFGGYSYKESGYYDSNKVLGSYNAIDYGFSNDYGGYYLNLGYWEKLEDFLMVNQNTWNAKNARITEYGYAFLDSVTLNVDIIYNLSQTYGWWIFSNKVQVGSDSSTKINGKYIGGKVGKGCVEVEYIDDDGASFSTYTLDVFNKSTSSLSYNNGYNDKTFNKVGRYVVRVYYKVTADYSIYVMKELSFAVISSSNDCEVIKGDTQGEDATVLSSYSLSLNNQNNIVVNYNGQEEYRATNDDVINFVSGSVNESVASEKTKKINELKAKIKKYKEYKVYFTNQGFYIYANGNRFVQITETTYGYSNAITNTYLHNSPANTTDGVYCYETQNLYKLGSCYYQVYMQSQPNKQVFRNVTYSYSIQEGEEERVVNYAIDYAFMEDLKIFPYTMTTKLYYQDISKNSDSGIEVEYKSNTIIYNTGDDILKLKFTVLDASGNRSELYLYIYPPKVPTLNKEEMMKQSYDYNYLTSGYCLKLYDSSSKTYKNHLFSSQNVAIENALNEIINNPEITTQNQDGSYDVRFNIDGTNILRHFTDNPALVDWIYTYCDNIEYVCIAPSMIDDYVIPEKVMHFDTLYLSPDYFFVTDKTFPLFESYKIYFTYYSQSGNVIKEGIITYDGRYKYGTSMLDILADGDMSKWQSGYVSFTEYNISANGGNTYVAYIVNSNPTLSLKYKDGTRFVNKNYHDACNITCEEFTLNKQIQEDTSVIINHNGEQTIYNYFNFDNVKFNEVGNYAIQVQNTHGFSYQINILVQGLSSFITGVENFGITYSNVTFRTDTLNFEYYLNGKKQSTDNYQSYNGNEYLFVFTRQDVDSNIYLNKNGQTFSFVLKGDYDFDISIYNVDAYNSYSFRQVKEYRRSLQDVYEVLQTNIDAIEDTNKEMDSINLQANMFDQNLNKKFEYKQFIANMQNYLIEIQEIDNEVFKLNENYRKIDILSEKLIEISATYQTLEARYKNYFLKYFQDKGINVKQEVYEEIVNLTEMEIFDLYAESIIKSDSYKTLFEKVTQIKTDINNIKQSKTDFENSFKFVCDNYTSYNRIDNLTELIKNIQNKQSTNPQTIKKLKNSIDNITCGYTDNPFVKYGVNIEINEKKEELTKLINEATDVSYSQLYQDIKDHVRQLAISICSSYQEQVDSLSTTLESYINKIAEIEAEKEWWKIFSNIGRNNQINDLKAKIKEMYTNYNKELKEHSDELKYMVASIKSFNSKSEYFQVEDFISEDLENLKKDIDSLLSKLSLY
ncbi:MAG: RICIN domain-containing protein [Clostridia bacterium]|nr:RICIN domain-containing protein [Clostridia bacterium]